MRIDPVKLVSELKRKDMTQKQVAAIAGVSRSTINGIASGRRCSSESAQKIADALNIDLNEILMDQEVQRGRA